MPTLLIADDAPAVRDLLRDYFDAKGYRVVTASDGKEALAAARAAAPDLVLLDVMMPWMDGFEVVREIRREADTPIILLTARVVERDRVAGLDLGADDYITKPFNLQEVEARVRAVLRRYRPPEASGVLRGGDIVLDEAAHRVSVGGEAVPLTRSEFTLLAALMRASGRVLSREALLGALGHTDRSTRTVDVHIRNLRTKVEPSPEAPAHVETVVGVGYRFRV